MPRNNSHQLARIKRLINLTQRCVWPEGRWIGPSRWTISKVIRISCRYRVRVTGSWRDGLVDSGSAVTAVSRSFIKTLVEAGAPVGDLRPTVRKLRCANGSQIDISGCSSCVVSFLGLRTEFPILVCDLSTDAIIGTPCDPYYRTRWTLRTVCCLFTEGGVSLQLHRRDASLSGRVFTVGHCSIPPHSEAVLQCTTHTVGGRSLPPNGLLEGLTGFFFREHRLGGRPDAGGSIGMEGPCVGVKLRSRNGHGGTIFRDWHDCPGVSDSAHYGPATPSVV